MPPQSLIDHAENIGADLWLMGRDFNYQGDKQQWAYGGRTQRRNSLAYPALRGANQLLNASAALAALEALRMRLPVGAQEVRAGLAMVELPGRFQVLPGRPTTVLDVAHNPHAAAALAQNLGNMGFHRLHLCGVRHHAGQGYRRRHRAHGAARRPLVRDGAAVAALGRRRAILAAKLRSDAKPAGAKADEFSVKTFADPADGLRRCDEPGRAG